MTILIQNRNIADRLDCRRLYFYICRPVYKQNVSLKGI